MHEASLMQEWDYQNGLDFAVEETEEKLPAEVVAKQLSGVSRQ